MTENSFKKTFHIRVYGGLNDFMPGNFKQKTLNIRYKTPITVAEIIESMGIPRSEVALILVNSNVVEPSFRLSEDDFISLYPPFETIDISGIKYSKTNNSNYPKFILDAHLGKLAKYLRMLGFDTLYDNNFEDQTIINIAGNEHRIILSRDKLLLGSKEVQNGYYVRSIEKQEQLREIVTRFNLSDMFRSFTRCMTCNTILTPKNRYEIASLIDKEIADLYNEFFYCPICMKVFWKGSHFMRMEELIMSLLK